MAYRFFKHKVKRIEGFKRIKENEPEMPCNTGLWNSNSFTLYINTTHSTRLGLMELMSVNRFLASVRGNMSMAFVPAAIKINHRQPYDSASFSRRLFMLAAIIRNSFAKLYILTIILLR